MTIFFSSCSLGLDGIHFSFTVSSFSFLSPPSTHYTLSHAHMQLHTRTCARVKAVRMEKDEQSFLDASGLKYESLPFLGWSLCRGSMIYFNLLSAAVV